MAGTWTPLKTQPTFSTDTMLLLTDGSVLVHEFESANWHKLTSDSFGNYVNGGWSPVAPLPDNPLIPPAKGGPTNAPLYFASAVLRDGRAFVAGGEYNSGISGADTLAAAIYDPVGDSWKNVAPPPGWTGIGDAPSCLLADGRLLLGSINGPQTAIYDSVADVWIPAGDKINATSSEETWTLQADGTVLTANCVDHPLAQKYVPATNTWVAAGATPDDLVEAASIEIGPALLLPDGRVFAVGATGFTALYTRPALPGDPGTWARGPVFPSPAGGPGLGAKDAPAALLPNGKVLCVVGPVDGVVDHYLAPSFFFEFDPATATLTEIASPPNGAGEPYTGRMLLLPSGEVLFANGTRDIEVYTPDGAPNPAWKPKITSCPAVLQAGQTYVLRGTQLNGLSQAVSYGDDSQSATNYPVMRVRNLATGHVFYCRTANHSTMGVATGAAIQSTEFTVPPGMESGASELCVVANGISSDCIPLSVGCPAEGECMGVSKLNIWVSDVADPCGTYPGSGYITVLDCKGILSWPCGRYLAPDGTWQPVPNGQYRNLPFTCGHLIVEVPPGCYWTVAGYVTPNSGYIHLNYTTHVGIVEVCCDECACVKLYNPSVRICWNWFQIGMRILSAQGVGGFDREKVEQVQKLVEGMLKGVPVSPAEATIAAIFEDSLKLRTTAKQGERS